MSADNVIYVQQRADGRWWVWMGFASDDEIYGPKTRDASYHYRFEALAYAKGLFDGSSWVEYGIRELEPEPGSPEVDEATILRKNLANYLAPNYRLHPAVIAKLCDEHLDKTGKLLGYVREAAAKK